MNGAEEAPREPASPEEERVVAEFKARHYADWADRPLPALKGRTPRECARTAAGRRMVDLLLKDMEHREHRSPGQSFDFSTIRRNPRPRPALRIGGVTPRLPGDKSSTSGASSHIGKPVRDGADFPSRLPVNDRRDAGPGIVARGSDCRSTNSANRMHQSRGADG